MQLGRSGWQSEDSGHWSLKPFQVEELSTEIASAAQDMCVSAKSVTRHRLTDPQLLV